MTRTKIGIEIEKGLLETIDHLDGKITLKTAKRSIKKPKSYTAAAIMKLREQINVSQAVFAQLCNVSAKAVQAWEQGLRKPNGAALRLMQIFETHQELIDELR
ncbi:type II toxin-antitoxin system MqsA family antitoxin [bacterium]|nr:type II toxin-antitoxin system MqsA family antitoxin [bacterium]